MARSHDRVITAELVKLAEDIKSVKEYQKAINDFYRDQKVNWGRIRVITEFTLMFLDKFPEDALEIIGMFCEAHEIVLENSENGNA